MPSTIERNTPTFNLLRRLVDQVARGEYEITATNVSPLSKNKIKWLRRMGHDLTAVTPSVQNAAITAMRAAFRELVVGKGNIRLDPALDIVAKKVGEYVVLRLTQQRGYGTPWAPPAAATVQSKLHSKDPAVRSNAHKFGVATGDLLEDLEAATWVLRRK